MYLCFKYMKCTCNSCRAPLLCKVECFPINIPKQIQILSDCSNKRNKQAKVKKDY